MFISVLKNLFMRQTMHKEMKSSVKKIINFAVFSPADGGSLVAKGALLAPSSSAGHPLYLATGSGDGTARITEISTGREVLCVRHEDWV